MTYYRELNGGAHRGRQKKMDGCCDWTRSCSERGTERTILKHWRAVVASPTDEWRLRQTHTRRCLSALTETSDLDAGGWHVRTIIHSRAFPQMKQLQNTAWLSGSSFLQAEFLRVQLYFSCSLYFCIFLSRVICINQYVCKVGYPLDVPRSYFIPILRSWFFFPDSCRAASHYQYLKKQKKQKQSVDLQKAAWLALCLQSLTKMFGFNFHKNIVTSQRGNYKNLL